MVMVSPPRPAAPSDPQRRGRGRPQLHGDELVLGAALDAFAEVGYEAMSMRSLGRRLGLSHGALNQRFGSKEQLFYAAVDHGFGDLADAMQRHSTRWPSSSALDDIRNGIRAFLLASAERPQIVRLMNTLGIAPSDRLDYVFAHHIGPMIEPLRAASEVTVTEVSARELFFLIAHGAAAAFTLQGLSAHFDNTDGPLDPARHADHLANLLARAVTIQPNRAKSERGSG